MVLINFIEDYKNDDFADELKDKIGPDAFYNINRRLG